MKEGESGNRRKIRIKRRKRRTRMRRMGLGWRRKGGSDGYPIRSESEGCISFLYLHFTYRRSLPFLLPPLLCSGNTWILGLIRATCQGLTRTCYPSVSDDWALSRSLSLTHTHTNTHTHTVRVCNRNQLGFQGCAAGQTGPFITL